MTLTEAIDKAGGNAPFGRTLEPAVSGQAVGVWRRRGWVPVGRAAEIERLYGVPARDILSPAVREAVGHDR